MKNKKRMIVAGIALILLVLVGVVAVNISKKASRREDIARQLELGKKQLTSLEYEEAIATFKNALAIDPKDRELLAGLVEAEEAYANSKVTILLADISSSEEAESYLVQMSEKEAILQEAIEELTKNEAIKDNPGYQEASDKLNSLIEEIQKEKEDAEMTKKSPVMLEMEYRNGYDYLLYSESDNQLILGFNYPYRSDCFIYNKAAPSEYRFVTDYAKEIDSQIYGCNSYISIWSGGCEEIIGKEERGSVETIYGTAQLYYIEDWEYAALKVGDDRVFVSYGESGNDKQYKGILEKMLPVLFTPIEIDESKKIVAEKNEISIDNKYNTYMKGGVYQGETAVKYILGFNSFDTIGSGEWDCTPLLTDPNGDFEAFKMENMDWGDDDHGEILITHNPCYYNYFFGGRGEVKIEEKASVETPYGTARIFFAVRQETDFPEDEEVAIINNYGANIIIDYRAQGKTASGIYGGRLEKYIPMMFE